MEIIKESENELENIFEKNIELLKTEKFKNKIKTIHVKIEEPNGRRMYWLGNLKKVFADIVLKYGYEIKTGKAKNYIIEICKAEIADNNIQFFVFDWDRLEDGIRLKQECHQLFFVYLAIALNLEDKMILFGDI